MHFGHTALLSKPRLVCHPIDLTIGKLHLPVELEHKAYWAIKILNFDLDKAHAQCKLQLNELEEIRNDAYDNARIYK